MLTKEEKNWLRRVQRALDACPSDRLGFYTTGDNDVTIYDRDIVTQEVADQGAESADFCTIVEDQDAYLDKLNIPQQVHSTAG